MMKKIIIGAAVAAAIGVGVYLGKDKIGNTVADVADTQVTEFINTNLNKPIVIKELQSHPYIKTATFTITNKTDNTVRSELTVATATDDSLTIPLNSEIVRGKVDYNGKTFGFGKIITKPDLSGFDDLPKWVNNDLFSLEQYIDLMGNVSELYRMAPIKETEDGTAVDFKGIEMTLDTQLINRSSMDGVFKLKGLDVTSPEGESMNLSPFDYTMKLEESGNYTASSTPINFAFSNPADDESFSMALSKGTYSGIYKVIDGLDMPINNGEGFFDSFTLGDAQTQVTMTNLAIAGGLYEADGSDKVNLLAKVSADVDPNSLPTALPDGQPIPVKLQSFALNYGLHDLSKETLNLYQKMIGSLDPEADTDKIEGEMIQLAGSLQKSDAKFSLGAQVTAEEGKTDANVSLALSEAGKTADIEALMDDISDSPEQAAQFFNGDLLVTMDEGFADATNLTMMAQMFLGITAENGQLTLKGELKNGQATLNGQPIPLN